jgi:peptide/nickel transport system substrate-binding protein
MKPAQLVLAAGAAALAVTGVTAPAAAQGERVSVAVSAPPRTMNPHGSDADSNLSVMANVFEGLLQRTREGELKPALATDWERIDAETWRFELRKGVEFHNGNDFTWEDVKFSLNRMANPKVSEFLNFGAQIESVERVDGDDWTIDITTKGPLPYFVQNLHQVFIMDKESTMGRSAGEVGQNPIGTGPYRFVEWVKGSYLRLEANPDYWGDQPEVKRAEIKPVTQTSTAIAAILSGQVDVLQDVPVSAVERIRQNDQVELITRPARRSIWLGLTNEAGEPGADLRVRKAMYHAINEPAIIENVMFGRATPAAQIPDPPTTGHSEDIARLEHDPEKARELLKEAGYADGFSIELDGPNDRYVQDEQILQTVASQLARVGIDVKVDAKPKSIFFEEVANNELDFYLIGWFDGSYDFGRSYSKLLHSIDKEAGFGGLNGARYSNPELDAQFAKARRIVDPERRAEALEKLNEMAMEQVAVIPLHFQQDIYAIRKASDIAWQPRSDTWIVFKEMARASK